MSSADLIVNIILVADDLAQERAFLGGLVSVLSCSGFLENIFGWILIKDISGSE